MKRQFQIDFLRDHGMTPTDHVLDLGCGTLRGGVPIISYLEPGGYVGVDVRAEAIDEAFLELADSGLESKGAELVLTDDLSELDLGRDFDIIWAFSVLIHLSDDILVGALDFIGRHLREGGVVCANVKEGPRSDGSWDEFPGVIRPADFYREAMADRGLVMEDIGSLPELGHRAVGIRDRDRMLALRKV